MTKALVLGVGNILLKDEGVGVRTVEYLQTHHTIPDNVELLDGGTMGMELLVHLEGIDHLLIIDAAETGEPPGTIIRLADKNVPAYLQRKISPHQLGISDILSALALQGLTPPKVTLIGIQPLVVDTGLELTPGVAAKVPELARMALEELQGWGYE